MDEYECMTKHKSKLCNHRVGFVLTDAASLLVPKVHIYRQSVNMGQTSMSELQVNRIIEALKFFHI